MTGGTDNPYIFIVDTARRSALLKYDGNKWVPTDTTGQPVSPTGLFSGMVGDGNGHFYIAPINRDQNDGLRIMKYTIPMTTGIANKNNNIQKGNICISPVPASQTLYIRNSNTALNGAQAIITDIQGRNVHQFTIAASQNIDISRWPTGIYCLHLPDGLVLKMLKN
jgi:hypothetical protein